jgi:hypothetical protein
MAIDYIIDYDCTPKQTLTTNGILERLKGQARAQEIIRMFRDAGDARPPSQMGFQLTRRNAAGEAETEDIVVQSLLDQAEQLKPLEQHCVGCPANRSGKPFGCMGAINYPITGESEAWLLNRLPTPDDTLVWLLLKRGVDNFLYDGQTIAALRIQGDTYFEDRKPAERRLGEFSIDANQVFEMMFTVGDIIPNHAGVLLLFFHAIPRELDAAQIMQLTPAAPDADEQHPFLLDRSSGPDPSTNDLKAFFRALYIAWKLHVKVIIDA